jgi:putative peptidoglycan lipid II flippase
MSTLFRRVFSDRSYTVKAASALLAVTALLSNGLGLFRNLIFYRWIPLSQLDIYSASFRIPDFLFNLIIFGAVISAFVPIATELLSQKKKEEAWQVTNQLFTWLTVLFAILGIALAVGMEPIMRVVVSGFNADRFHSAVTLSRLMLIQPIFFAWSFTLGGLLNSSRRFSSFALAPLIYNISLIIGGFIARTHGIIAITYAVIIGAFLHFAVQYWELRGAGYKLKLDFHFGSAVKEIFTLMIPRSLSQGMGQLVLIVYTTLASQLQAGSIAIFSGMNDLQTTPTVIVANSLSAAFFPSLAIYITAKDWPAMNNLLSKTVRIALFILIPTIALTFILRAQIVRLYVGIGHASWDTTHIAIHTLVWFLFGIVQASLVVLLSKVFYSFKNTMTPMYISIFAGACSMITAYVGIQHFHGSVATLAVAETVLSTVQCTLYIYVLYRHENVRLRIKKLASRSVSYLFASGVVAATTWLTLQGIDAAYQRLYAYYPSKFFSTDSIIGLFIQLLIAGAVGIVTYLGYSMVMHQEELQWLKRKRFTNSQ